MFPPSVGYMKQDYVSTDGEIEPSECGYPIWCDEKVGKGNVVYFMLILVKNTKIINQNESWSINYLNQIVLTCIFQLNRRNGL